MEKDRIEGEVMFLPLIGAVLCCLAPLLPDTHEGVNGHVLVGVKKETRQEIDDIREENQTEHGAENHFGD